MPRRHWKKGWWEGGCQRERERERERERGRGWEGERNLLNLSCRLMYAARLACTVCIGI